MFKLFLKPNFSLVLQTMILLAEIQPVLSQDSTFIGTIHSPTQSNTNQFDQIKSTLDKAIYPTCIIFMVLCLGMTVALCLQSRPIREKLCSCFFKPLPPPPKTNAIERWETIEARVETLSDTINRLKDDTNLSVVEAEQINSVEKRLTEFKLLDGFEDKIDYQILEDAHITDDGNSYTKHRLKQLEANESATPLDGNKKVKIILRNYALNDAINDFLTRAESLIEELAQTIKSIQDAHSIIGELPQSSPAAESTSRPLIEL
ncbi:MAG: hypothetical protein EPN84_11140 [Legionella sp.]|nr:MAG: hypothetical protein EPN84_11140 [Legionella sp.]